MRIGRCCTAGYQSRPALRGSCFCHRTKCRCGTSSKGSSGQGLYELSSVQACSAHDSWTVFLALIRIHKNAHVFKMACELLIRIISKRCAAWMSAQWEKVENKPAFIIYSVAAFSAIWLSSTVINALNSVPLFPKLFELVGLGYSAWFTYRYLLFKSSREELVADIEQLKKKISGEQ
jgi:hypothetical protein